MDPKTGMTENDPIVVFQGSNTRAMPPRRVRASPCTVTSLALAMLGQRMLSRGSRMQGKDKAYHRLVGTGWLVLAAVSAANHSMKPKCRAVEWVDRGLAHTVPGLHLLRYPNRCSLAAFVYAVTVFYGKTAWLRNNSCSLWHASMHMVTAIFGSAAMDF